jgi:hypothetical protein
MAIGWSKYLEALAGRLLVAPDLVGVAARVGVIRTFVGGVGAQVLPGRVVGI